MKKLLYIFLLTAGLINAQINVNSYAFASKEIGTATYTGKSIAMPAGQMMGMQPKSDGSKLFIRAHNIDNISSYSFGTNWDLITLNSTASSTTGGLEISINGIYVKPDGLSFWVNDASTGLHEYSLSSAFDFSTNSSIIRTESVSGNEGIDFAPDGYTFIVNNGSNVYQYTLSTAWDISTKTLDYTFPKIGSYSYRSAKFNSDGTKLFVMTGRTIQQINLTTAYDIGGGYVLNSTMDYSNLFTTNYGDFCINPTGDIYIGTYNVPSKIYQIALDTPEVLPDGEVTISTDADADAFITAAGITDQTQKDAITNMVLDLKTASLWGKFYAIYPLVGGTSSSHKYNLKDPRDLDAAYRITFSGTITHNSDGAKGETTNSVIQANTNMTLAALTEDNNSMFYYDKTERSDTGGVYDIGTSGQYLLTEWKSTDENIYVQNGAEASSQATPNGTTSGFWGMSRISSTEYKVYKNGAVFETYTSTSGTFSDSNQIAIMGSNGTAYQSGDTYAFASIGEGLTDSEVSDLYDIVIEYQTTLGRKNLDEDTLKFLTATGITNATQKEAINTLVTTLKADGLWDKMIAIYPLVGGTATTHKYNLKNAKDTNAAYRITWNGTITHDSNGATGSNANTSIQADTNLNVDDLGQDSNSMFYYDKSERSTSVGIYDIGGNGMYISTEWKSTDEDIYTNNSNAYGGDTPNGTTLGFWGMSRTSSSSWKVYHNGSVFTTYSGASSALSGSSLGIMGTTSTTGQSPDTYAFACFGEGLTDSEVSDLYDAVLTFETTLGREN